MSAKAGKEKAHTPGPWVVGEDYEDDQNVIGPNGFPVASVAYTAILPRYDEKLGLKHWADGEEGQAFVERTAEEVDANRRLIAAAPDLYAALKALSRVPAVVQVLGPASRHTGGCDCPMCRAAAALARVNGE